MIDVQIYIMKRGVAYWRNTSLLKYSHNIRLGWLRVTINNNSFEPCLQTLINQIACRLFFWWRYYYSTLQQLFEKKACQNCSIITEAVWCGCLSRSLWQRCCCRDVETASHYGLSRYLFSLHCSHNRLDISSPLRQWKRGKPALLLGLIHKLYNNPPHITSSIW